MIVTSAELDSPGLRFTSAKGRWVLFATILGSGIAFLDGSVVNVALPSIGRDFHVGLADLQWTVTSYTLTLSAFLLLGGSLGDRYGRRFTYQINLLIFGIASFVAAFAPNMDTLNLVRFVMGLGLGAEIGISTDKLHARGPCGVKELTSYKYVVYGAGHVRQ